MATRGGKRAGAGRPAGAQNRLTRTLKEKAAAHADDVLAVLVEVATNPSQPAAARVHAATAVLDRGFGRPSVAVDVAVDIGLLDSAALEKRFVSKMNAAHERQAKLLAERRLLAGD